MLDSARSTHPKKITVLGMGDVGVATAIELRLQYPDAEIVCCSRDSDKATGTALAIDTALRAKAKLRGGGNIGTGDYTFTSNVTEAVDGSDFVFVAGGPARKAGEQREDLLGRSVAFMDWVIAGINELRKSKPSSLDKITWMVGTNPLDLMSQYLAEKGNISPDRICAPLGGELDTLRLEQSIAINLQKYYNQKLKYAQIRKAAVIGEHGKSNMIPVLSNIEVNLNGDGSTWQKLYDLETPNGERVVDQLVDVPAVGIRPATRRTMLEEFKDATVEGGTKMTEFLGKSEPTCSAITNVWVTKRITDAINGVVAQDADQDFYASAPIKDEKGTVMCFLSQKVHANQDGSLKPVACQLDEAEQNAWNSAVKAQTERWKQLPADLEVAKQNAEKKALMTKLGVSGEQGPGKG